MISGLNKPFKLKRPDAFTRWNREKEITETDNLPSKFDPIGYIDPNVRIQEMIKAGIRIDAWNHALYAVEHGVENLEDRLFEDWEENQVDNKLDNLDNLNDMASLLDRYRTETYRMYKNNLLAMQTAQRANETPQEAAQKESQTQNSVPPKSDA